MTGWCCARPSPSAPIWAKPGTTCWRREGTGLRLRAAAPPLEAHDVGARVWLRIDPARSRWSNSAPRHAARPETACRFSPSPSSPSWASACRIPLPGTLWPELRPHYAQAAWCARPGAGGDGDGLPHGQHPRRARDAGAGDRRAAGGQHRRHRGRGARPGDSRRRGAASSRWRCWRASAAARWMRRSTPSRRCASRRGT